MSRRPHYPTEPSADATAFEGAPESVTKQEFGRRLHRKMLDKGWTQSELARRADLGRDSVSTYVRGLVWPDPVNLEKLSRALGCEPGDLLPGSLERGVDQEIPAIEIKQAQGGKVWLRVNKAVPGDVAAQVFSLISKE